MDRLRPALGAPTKVIYKICFIFKNKRGDWSLVIRDSNQTGLVLKTRPKPNRNPDQTEQNKNTSTKKMNKIEIL